MKINKIEAREIIDSRGEPTVECAVELAGGAKGTFSVPSGASTGEHEAWELRDADMDRYGGKGVLKAVNNVNGTLYKALKGKDAKNQIELDHLMIELDGTRNKAKLGANAILSVSIAAAKAQAAAEKKELYVYLRDLYGLKSPKYILPVPMFNIYNGGKHADNNLSVQEYKLAPQGAKSFTEALRWGDETYHALKELMREKKLSTNVGDEGGFAAPLENDEMPIKLIQEAVGKAGYKYGTDISLGLDLAASSFCHHHKYSIMGKELLAEELLELYKTWIQKYKLISLEDPFEENAWEEWKAALPIIGHKTEIIGDDLLTTNPEQIKKAIDSKVCNAALIKVNQIGTLTESFEAIRLAQQAGWEVEISHRSGETGDVSIADLAVAVGARQLKSGAPARGERVAKYDRLLEIEKQLGANASYPTNLFTK